jgi:hypothetical protein
VRERSLAVKKEEGEENATNEKFIHQGPAYFGVLNEVDGELLKFEGAAEKAGNVFVPWSETRAGRLAILYGHGRVAGAACVLA